MAEQVQVVAGDDPDALLARAERRDAAEHRRQILEVARALIAQHGVEAVSMHQIARGAGVGQGTLYRRYANKGELCVDLLVESGERFRQDVETYLATSDLPALARLDGVLERIIAFMDAHAPYLATIDTTCADNRSPEIRNPYYMWVHRVLTGLLATAVEGGELPALDVTYTADALLSAIRPELYAFQRDERGYTPERVLQGVRRIFILGLREPENN